jgi:Glycosyltransferase family 87
VFVLVAAAASLAWEDGSPLVPRDAGRADQGGAPGFLVLLIAAFALYLLGLWLVRRWAAPVVAVLVLGAAVQLVPLAAPLLLSTDAWTYWEYGWIANDGGNPYTQPPEDFPDNPAFPYAGADWRDTTSVYGPAFTLSSQPVAAVAGDSSDAAAWIFKALAAAAAVGATVLASGLARAKAFAAAFVGWNPLLAIHLAGGGHNDAWIAVGVAAALALAAAGRRYGAGAVWALAVLVKWIPVVFLALRALEGRSSRRLLGFAALAGVALAIGVAASVQWGLHWVTAFGPLAANAGTETSYAIPHRLEQLGLPDEVAFGLAIAVFAAGALWLGRQALRGRARLAPAAVLVLVTTPWLAVWYTAWAVTLAAAEDDGGAQIAVLVLCAYLLPQTIPL